MALQDWQKEALAVAFQYVDQEDFDYIEELLRRSIKHPQDIRPRFWLAVMEGCSSVLHKKTLTAV
jgi:hypothetical protein